MTILEKNSKLLVEAIKDLYLKGKYELGYAIVQLNKFYTNGRIIQADYEEYCKYFKSEKEKQNAVVNEEKTTAEETENVENSVVTETVEENTESEENV